MSGEVSESPISKEYERHWLLKLSIAEAAHHGTISREQFDELLAYLYTQLEVERREGTARISGEA